MDITFGDYLRALVTADRDAISEDTAGYRTALINASRARGIRPEGAISYSEEALSWHPYKNGSWDEAKLRSLFYDLIRYEDESDDQVKSRKYDQLKRQLWYICEQHREEFGFPKLLSNDGGLSIIPIIHPESVNPLPLARVLPNGSLQRQIVAEFVVEENVPVDPSYPDGDKFTFYGGTTILIARQGNVRVISKPIHGDDGARRLERQRSYLRRLTESSSAVPYIAFDPKLDRNFRAIHRGY